MSSSEANDLPQSHLNNSGEIRFLLFALVTGLLWSFQRRLIYLPDNGPVPPAADALPGPLRDPVPDISYHLPVEVGR